MKYEEGDFFSGPLSSCFLNPLYHPACLCCMDRNECYGEDEYLRFREKALIMSELLDNPDCLTIENSCNLAAALDTPDLLYEMQQVLTGKYCTDGKIWTLMKISLGKPY